MPSIRYVNQSAPFWDFVASLENQNNDRSGEDNEAQAWSPWGWGPWGHHGMPHRGRRGGPPPPPEHPADRSTTPPPPFEERDGSPATEKGDTGEPSNPPPKDGPPEGRPCGPAFGRRGGCHGRRGGPPGSQPFARGPHGHHGHGHHRRGGFPFGGPFGGFGGLAGAFFDEARDSSSDFIPEVDVFDTESAYIIHLSLPGAKKEDVGVSWDPEKSELSVSGVVHRPGDEEFLKTLALDERKVGAFEKKVRLGSRANPAQVDVDAISAKLEEGILRVEVPKLDKDYVEVKMVDIE